MNILALDLGTTTGFALSPDKGALISGTWVLKPSRFEGGGMRFLRFRGFLEEANDNCPFNKVVFEEVRRHAGTDAAHVYGGLMATLTAWCEENEIPYEGVPVGTIKKYVTGKGNASKDEVIAALNALGYGITDHNEADAIALLLKVLS
jgi:Holliday junction resolvasome RuvABC endonuclease subunit